MVEINNQRKAFLDMLVVRRGDNGRQKTRNHGYDVIVGPESYLLIFAITLANWPLNPKLKESAADATASFPLVGCLPQAAWPERLLSESRDAVALQQIGRGALPMIDRGDAIIRQSTVAAISGLHCRALVMVGFEHKADELEIAKFKGKQARWSGDGCMSKSHRDYLRSGYLHHRLPVMGC